MIKIIGILITIMLASPSIVFTSDQYEYEKEMAILRLFYTDKELVMISTRQLKPISKVAKNVCVITRKDIERMNAHNVADVLHRIPGIFLGMYSQDMGSPSFIQIYGSEERQVLVMIDDVPLNFHSEGSGELNSIPVDIIDRIEIIKGPASSSWGSSIGGVINIITKKITNSKKPKGYVKFSYGERYTYDTSAQVSGKYRAFGYYLFAERQHTDGLRNNRDFERNSLYSKFGLKLSDKLNMNVSVGYNNPDNDLGRFAHLDPALNLYSKNHLYFLRSCVQAQIKEGINLNFIFYHMKQKMNIDTKLLDTDIPYYGTTFDEETYGGRLRFGIKKGRHNATVGVDVERGDLDLSIDAGPTLQAGGGMPAESFFNPHREKWAIYANDTIDVGPLSIIPELRYDHDSLTGSFVSPSLGLAYRIGEHTVLRGQVARGFTLPPLSWMYGGGLFLLPNKDLDHERVVLYQIGGETSILKYLWIKGTLFRHEIDDHIRRVQIAGLRKSRYINDGDMKRHGIEIVTETIPFYGFTFSGSYTFVHFNPSREEGIKNLRKYTFGIRYEDHGIIGELFGTYIWHNLSSTYNANYDSVIWDFNFKKAIRYAKNKAYVYIGVHNLFNGSQYTFVDRKNPRRWVEVGLRIDF